MYDKEQAYVVGVTAVDTVQSLANGVQTGDVAQLVGLGIALMAAADELQADTDAAVLDIVFGAADHVATLRLAPDAAYDKAQVQAVGAGLVAAAYAVADGVDLTDITIGTELGTALIAAVNDFEADKDAALFDILAGAAKALADKRRG